MTLERPKIYLYIKRSPKGLYYLGKTIKNPYTYIGSGLVWKAHLSENNFTSKDIETRVIYATSDHKKFSEYAIKVSKKLNVVCSDQWANMVYEEGQGGNTWNHISEEGKQKFLESTKRKKTDVHKRKIADSLKGTISTQRKAVIQFSLDGVFIAEYESLSAACQALGRPKNQGAEIINVIRGSRVKMVRGVKKTINCNHAFGYKWKYKNVDQ